MLKYEYKVVPAPNKGRKEKGVKGPEAQFAAALAAVMNEHGAEGWEYQRAECLPVEERRGLTGRNTVERHMLVFRREVMERSDHPMLPPLGASEGGAPRKGLSSKADTPTDGPRIGPARERSSDPEGGPGVAAE